MAKTKVFELAKEFEIKSSDVLTFLQEKGIEAKAAQSSVEDDAAALVRSHFGKKNAPAEKPVAPKAEKAEAPKAAPVKTEEPKQEKSPEGDSPKKKKKIIFVSNPNNSKIQGQNSRPQGNNNNQGNGNGQNRRPQGGQGNMQVLPEVQFFL